MKNLVSTEKMLKHWLKKRVTITTATVVGFLLMGTAAFGEEITSKVEINDNYTVEKEKHINVVVKEEKTQAKGIQINRGNPKVKVENKGSINVQGKKYYAKGIHAYNDVEIINDGSIMITGKADVQGIQGENNINVTVKNGENAKITTSGTGKVFAIQTNGTGRGEIENSGTISTNSMEKAGVAMTISFQNGGTVLNKKSALIEASAPEGPATGIYANAKGEKDTKITNNGTINASGKTLATGIHLNVNEDYSGTTENMIENNGEIIASSDNFASAITVTNKSNKKISIKNGENGILNVDGKGDHKTGAVRLDSTNGEISFINNGTIKIKDGTAISIKGESVKAEIGGKVEVSGNSIVVKNTDGTAEITGTITLTDKTQQDITQDDINNLFRGEVKITGIIADKNNVHYKTNNIVCLEKGTTDDINALGKDSQSVTMGNKNVDINKNDSVVAGITAGKEAANIKSLNIIGDVKIGEFKNDSKIDKQETIKLAVKDLNLDANGKLHIAQGDILEIIGSNVNKLENLEEKNKEAIVLRENSKLILNGANVNGAGITGVDSSATIKTLGNTSFNGIIKNVGTINVDSGNLSLSADSKYEKDTDKANMTINGNVNLAVGAEKNKDGEYTQNFFNNSNGFLNVTGNGTITIGTENINGKTAVINLGENNEFAKDLTGKITGNGIYEIKAGDDLTDKKIEIVYKSNIFGNSILDSINGQAYEVNDLFDNNNLENRKVQFDKIYSSNIYSETVKAAYDTVKMNEEAVLSLARKSEVGKWTAEGKALYSKDEYNRKGTVGDYSSEIESTGLMAAFGYGLNETTTAGVAFSGVKQDVDTDGGSADADLFYLGLYGNKVYGNYDFTAGLGYQFGEYEADNTIANVHGSDKYDSKALSGYVQGRYTADLGDGLSLQPRVRLGYTYVEQDDTRDSYFGVSDAEITTFDAEFGLDTVKSIQLEKSKVDVKFGVSYVRTMGDTDDEFTGRFYGTTASEGFNVLGAELAENVVKFNLGAEVTNENGFFYNGGFTYEFGSNDTDAYGVNVGVGYRF
ncbi:autotransporter domain-containing protein [Fusobacterium perfoetens]|uniref:autotransporter family protein n=1 Tax=Fusobacterium perfoetens TaxID=852 RepID=UPI001F428ED4|nr:autotransporter outer membrane beta-barrel domain-containing protein [Fusobacterium perfoetens]MCF2624646.1 autotransporter domain-containing protein [Fusobacterium perfoetens]